MAHHSPPPVFSLENVDFAYADGRPVLRGVNLVLEEGRQLGLYGPNGSGKTTLFRIIAGLERPSAGRVLLRGRPVDGEKDFQALRLRVGLVLQHAEDQLFCPTVLEDVAFGPLNLGLPPEAARECAVRTLRGLGMEGFEDRLTHRLSGGEKKLVSLATVLAMAPDALLLDEPTNGLDPEARERIIEILQQQSTARIIISHDWDFLSRTASEPITLREGRLMEDAPVLPHAHVHAHPLISEEHVHPCLK